MFVESMIAGMLGVFLFNLISERVRRLDPLIATSYGFLIFLLALLAYSLIRDKTPVDMEIVYTIGFLLLITGGLYLVFSLTQKTKLRQSIFNQMQKTLKSTRPLSSLSASVFITVCFVLALWILTKFLSFFQPDFQGTILSHPHLVTGMLVITSFLYIALKSNVYEPPAQTQEEPTDSTK